MFSQQSTYLCKLEKNYLIKKQFSSNGYWRILEKDKKPTTVFVELFATIVLSISKYFCAKQPRPITDFTTPTGQ